jgi:hypothetical protein
MIRKMILHEFRQLASDRAIHALAAALFLTLAFGLWNGQRWVAFQREAIATAEQEAARAMTRAETEAETVRAGQKEVSWWENPADTRGFVESHLLTYASKPPGPLAAFGRSERSLSLSSAGQSRDAIGQAVRLL